MNFHAWYQSQKLKGNGINKDELKHRNLSIYVTQFNDKKEDLIYSPNTCLFVPRTIDRVLRSDIHPLKKKEKIDLAIQRFN